MGSRISIDADNLSRGRVLKGDVCSTGWKKHEQKFELEGELGE